MRDRWAGLGQRPEPSRRRESRAPPGTWSRELFCQRFGKEVMIKMGVKLKCGDISQTKANKGPKECQDSLCSREKKGRCCSALPGGDHTRKTDAEIFNLQSNKWRNTLA